MKIHIAHSPIGSKPHSLANRCKIIVIFTYICVSINKLLKNRSGILYGSTNRISSAISSTVLLLYRILLIFQILACPRQELELLAYGSEMESDVNVCVANSIFSDILWICKIWLVAQILSSHFSCFTQKSSFFTLICSLRFLPHNLFSFISLGIEINKIKVSSLRSAILL